MSLFHVAVRKLLNLSSWKFETFSCNSNNNKTNCNYNSLFSHSFAHRIHRLCPKFSIFIEKRALSQSKPQPDMVLPFVRYLVCMSCLLDFTCHLSFLFPFQKNVFKFRYLLCLIISFFAFIYFTYFGYIYFNLVGLLIYDYLKNIKIK